MIDVSSLSALEPPLSHDSPSPPRKRGPRFGFNEGGVHIDLIGEVTNSSLSPCDASIKRSAIAVRKNVDGRMLFAHVSKTICKWISVNRSGAPAFAGVTV